MQKCILKLKVNKSSFFDVKDLSLHHWLRDQVRLGNFTIIWQPGSINLADFFTKAHSVEHHLNMIKTYSVAEEGVLSNVHIHTTN